MTTTEHRTTVNIDIPATLPIQYRAALTAARPFLARAVSLTTYRQLYAQLRHADGDTFCARALATLNIAVDVSAGDLLQVPVAGPLVVAANHPHGMLDGLVLARVIEHQRRDVRILTNRLIAQLPGLPDLCLFVDPSDSGRPSARSTAGLRAALRWVADGHVLIVFPAGEVAHQRVGDAATPLDSAWHDTFARLAARTGAPILNAFIEGANSDWFYRAGRLHRTLRTLLLPRELLRKRGARITVRLGHVVPSSGNAADTSKRLRHGVDRLALRPHEMNREIRALSFDNRLLEGSDVDVFCARASEIPTVLDEIGRLREVTFRAVGEGTGKALDLDRFDQRYTHVFAWNRARSEVVGAYRLGLVDELVALDGPGGLYTSTLFRYDTRFLDRLGPAIELGRSFVREEYQRSSNVLLLLWKGIARFVARSGKYRVLFGPVSISSRYADTSQRLLQAFLQQNFCRRDLADLVQPISPPVTRPLPRGVDPTLITDVRDLDALVAKLERDGKGIPVLVRQYLRLNAKLLGFNVDPAFGNALDALMMVDLAEVAPAILTRYFGKSDAHALITRLLGARAA